MRINILLLSLLHVTFGIFAQEGDNVYSDYGMEEEPPGCECLVLRNEVIVLNE